MPPRLVRFLSKAIRILDFHRPGHFKTRTFFGIQNQVQLRAHMTRWTNDATAIREARALALALVEDRVTEMRRGVVQVSVGAITLDLVPITAADRRLYPRQAILQDRCLPCALDTSSSNDPCPLALHPHISSISL